MVMKFVGGSWVFVRRIIDTIPTVGSLRGGGFIPAQTLIGVKLKALPQ